MDFAPPSVRDAFARLRSMASSASPSTTGGKDEEAAALLLPVSSASAIDDKGAGGGAQLRGGTSQQQQGLHLPVSSGAPTKVGGLLSSAFSDENGKLSSSPSSFLPPPPPSPPNSPAKSAASFFFGRFFPSSSSSAPSSSSFSHLFRPNASAGRVKGKAGTMATATATLSPFSSSSLAANTSNPSSNSSSSSSSWEESLVTALIVASWYAANTGILLMNKALLSNFGFRRPLLLTLLHMTACAGLGRLCQPWESAVESGGRKAGGEAAPAWSTTMKKKAKGTKASTDVGGAPPSPPPFPARSKVAVLAATFCAAVVLGNVSLRFIPVSFAQAIGSTTPAFTAALAFLVLGAREPLAVYATLLPVVGGVVVATGFEPSFDALGFGTAVAATAARSLKAVLQGALLSTAAPAAGASSAALASAAAVASSATAADGAQEPDRSQSPRRVSNVGSMALLRMMAPVAAAMLLPATLVLEPGGFAATAAACRRSSSFAAFLAANAALSYVVNLTNFVVTKRTSPLTLHVLGNAKGVFATVVSVAVFKNPVSGVGAAGYLSAVGGTLLYGYLKQANKKEQMDKKDDESGSKRDAATKLSSGRGVAVDGAITIKAVAA